MKNKSPSRLAWLAKNDAALQARKKERYLANREQNRARSTAYHKAHRERLLAYGRKKFLHAQVNTPWRLLIPQARIRAIKKGLPFDLTHEWAASRWTGKCELSGIEFRLGQKGSGPKTFAPSIDRKIPSLGYTQANCRIILFGLNAMKGPMTDEEMIFMASALLKNHGYQFQKPADVMPVYFTPETGFEVMTE